MTDLILVIVAIVLVNNFVLTRYPGLLPFLSASTATGVAMRMSLATTFVLTLASGLAWLTEHFLLLPFGLEYLRLLAFILIIAGTVQFTATILRSSRPMLQQTLGIYLPLITTNCAILGVALLYSQASRSFLETLAYALGAGLGFCIVMMLFTCIRERIAVAEVPAPFRDAAIVLITAGMMTLAFLGLAGLSGK